MILSICLSPSLDYAYYLDKLEVDKLNRTEEKVSSYAGKGVNVAVGVATLGGKSLLLATMPKSSKKGFQKYLKGKKVQSSFIEAFGDIRTNVKIQDGENYTEINENGNCTFNFKKLLKKVKRLSKTSSITTISGKMPLSLDEYETLLKKIDGKIIIDSEKENLLIGSKYAYLLKPNLNELEEAFKRKFICVEEILEYANKLIDNGTKIVLVSMGAMGALITNGSESYFAKAINVNPVCLTGAGDAMVSALSLEIEKGANLEEMLISAISSATSSIIKLGSGNFEKKDVENFKTQLEVEKV